jgi:hypothetical protein
MEEGSAGMVPRCTIVLADPKDTMTTIRVTFWREKMSLIDGLSVLQLSFKIMKIFEAAH